MFTPQRQTVVEYITIPLVMCLRILNRWFKISNVWLRKNYARKNISLEGARKILRQKTIFLFSSRV